jgi:hypothetical protein
MVKTGFHYKSLRVWNELKEDKAEFIKQGCRLIRLRSITDPDIPILPMWAHDGYIFAFPDKDGPESWKTYEHGKREWDSLIRNIGGEKTIEFKFDILPTDNAFVVDRSHFADWQYRHTTDRQEAIRKYALSRVPANEYDGSFRMPELIIQNSIALERLVVNSVFERVITNERDKSGEYKINYVSCSLN